MPRVSLIVLAFAVGCAETVSAPPGSIRDSGAADVATDRLTQDGAAECGPEDPRCSDLVDPGDQVVWVDRDVNPSDISAYTLVNQHRHGVRLRPYRIGRFEVTNQLYRSCLDEGQCPAWGVEVSPRDGGPPTDYRTSARFRLHPAMINYAAAVAVCRYLGGDLPTRAQFQFAAHGGSSQRYPWGDTPECAGNFDGIFLYGQEPDLLRCARTVTSPRTEPVDTRPGARGPFGTYHLLGNIAEYIALSTETPEQIAALNRMGVFPYASRRAQRGDDLVYGVGGYATVTEVRLGMFGRMETTSTPASGYHGARCVWEVAAP
jgi:formylglycine-generating enzyme required for sulfatase activity